MVTRLVGMRLGGHMMMRQRSLVYRLRRHTLLNHGLLWHRFWKRHPLRAHRLPSQGLRRKDTLGRDRLLVMMWWDLGARRHTLLRLMGGHRLRASSFLRRWRTGRCRCIYRLVRR